MSVLCFTDFLSQYQHGNSLIHSFTIRLQTQSVGLLKHCQSQQQEGVEGGIVSHIYSSFSSNVIDVQRFLPQELLLVDRFSLPNPAQVEAVSKT